MINKIYRYVHLYLNRCLNKLNPKVIRNIFFATILLQLILSLVYWSIYNSPETNDSLSSLLSTGSIAYYWSNSPFNSDNSDSNKSIYQNPKKLDPDYEYFKIDSTLDFNPQSKFDQQNNEEIKEEYSDNDDETSSSSTWWDYLPTFIYDPNNANDNSLNDQNNRLLRLYKLYEKMKFNTKPIWIDDYTLDKFLTVPVGSNRGEKLESIDDLELYDFDPRTSWSVYLDHMMRNFQEGTSMKLPFSWYD